jgi:uncharacterized damage-inducible protein DinB
MEQRKYRPGGLGTMMDLYENETFDFIAYIRLISEKDFLMERPNESEDLRSIQMIMRHIVGSAYGYTNRIREALGKPIMVLPPRGLVSRDDAIKSLEGAIRYTEEALMDNWTMSDDDIDKTSMMSSWGVPYSLEQMLEHAIVHIMRHKRQIKRIIGG